MYENVKTWNPVIGCTHNCIYCYARKLQRERLSKNPKLPQYTDFKPKFVESQLDKIPNADLVFVTSMGDLFCDGVPNTWIKRVIDTVNEKAYSQKFLWQTKNPKRMLDFIDFFIEDRDILGVTIETNRPYDFSRKISDAPHPYLRLIATHWIRNNWKGELFVTIEPILGFDLELFVKCLREIKPDWIWIGYDNHGFNLPEPPLEKTLELIEELEKFTEVRRKTIRKAWYELKEVKQA